MNIKTQKQQMRDEIRTRRKALQDKDARSTRIFERLQTLDCWKEARSTLVYLSIGSEVETSAIVAALLAESPSKRQTCVVPWCREDGTLGLFRLIHPDEELAPGVRGIREPTPFWRQSPQRIVVPQDLDLVLLPGIAFDLRGGRLGQGRAYYDRLLSELPPTAVTVGLAFTCQIVPEVPRQPHDRMVDWVVTEEGNIAVSSSNEKLGFVRK